MQDELVREISAILGATRNGVIYGAKLRFCHAFVMTFVYRSGSLESKIRHILSATRQHATALGSFAFIFKSILLVLKLLKSKPKLLSHQKDQPLLNNFVAGLISGYIVYGRYPTSVTEQIVLYVFSRSLLGMANLSAGQTYKSNTKLANRSWAAVASLSWATVMTLFRYNPKVLQTSMLHSMVYIFTDSDREFLLDDSDDADEGIM